VTGKREKCALTSGRPAIMAAVTGSSTVFDEGVSMPNRMRSFTVYEPDDAGNVMDTCQLRLHPF
jgi:hypothetical protein